MVSLGRREMEQAGVMRKRGLGEGTTRSERPRPGGKFGTINRVRSIVIDEDH